MRYVITLVVAALVVADGSAQSAFKLAPAIAVEAEDFTIESGWKVIPNGHGNYMVDFNAI